MALTRAMEIKTTKITTVRAIKAMTESSFPEHAQGNWSGISFLSVGSSCNYQLCESNADAHLSSIDILLCTAAGVHVNETMIVVLWP